MKPEGLESEIKKIIDQAEYHPSEASWAKMQEALRQSNIAALAKPKRVFFGIPLRTAVATALTGVLMTSAVVYFVNNNHAKLAEAVNSSGHGMAKAGTLNQDIESQNNNAGADQSHASNKRLSHRGAEAGSHSLSRHTAHKLAYEEQSVLGFSIKNDLSSLSKLENAQASLTNISSKALKSSHPALNAEDFGEQNDMAAKVKSPKRNFGLGPVSGIYVGDWTSDLASLNKFEDPFIYGAHLKIGLPVVGKYQVEAGLTAKIDFDKHFFAEAGLEFTMTDVQYQKALYYHSNANGSYVNLGSGDAGNINTGNTAANGKTTNTYRNNVMSIGLAPMVGCNVSKTFSVALGGDMARNFNNGLILEKNPIVDQTQLKESVTNLLWINTWDAGLRAQVAYKVNKNLSAVGQFRKGLVNYMMDSGGKIIKNSSASLGLEWKLNP